MEQQPMVWNEIYSMQYRENSVLMVRKYFDNNYIKEYNVKTRTLTDTRKMTEEDHEFLNKKLGDMRRAFDRAYEEMRAVAEERKQLEFN